VAVAHSEDRPWLAEGEQKREAVQQMFGEIAPTYDLLNSIISFRFHYRWREAAVRALHLKPSARVLDLCCGTGDFIRALRRRIPERQILGIDFAFPMLEIAHRKAHVPLAAGDACRIPLQRDSVDAVTVGWGIRNVPDIDAAHREIFRVLKPGGKFVSLDMARARNPLIRWSSELVSGKLLPLIGGIFRRRKAYTYLPQSTKCFRTREELAESMRQAGFVDVQYRDLCFGNICMHVGGKP
jgi:demethylmenaquinone methyltransferase/2-methoxy-6-polyprenyl-1,4-benzoquinol methylase